MIYTNTKIEKYKSGKPETENRTFSLDFGKTSASHVVKKKINHKELRNPQFSKEFTPVFLAFPSGIGNEKLTDKFLPSTVNPAGCNLFSNPCPGAATITVIFYQAAPGTCWKKSMQLFNPPAAGHKRKEANEQNKES